MKVKHGYILRYYLPVKPHFDEDYTNKRFVELIDFCRKTQIESVMFYVALDPNWYYMPASLEYEKSVGYKNGWHIGAGMSVCYGCAAISLHRFHGFC